MKNKGLQILDRELTTRLDLLHLAPYVIIPSHQASSSRGEPDNGGSKKSGSAYARRASRLDLFGLLMQQQHDYHVGT